MTPLPPDGRSPVPPLRILILAAGLSRRMRGADKLLMPVNGIPQLRRLARAAVAAGAAAGAPVHLVLGPAQAARRQLLADLPVGVILAPRAPLGMGETLSAGLAALPSRAAVLLLLADLPEIGTPEIAALIAAHRADPFAILRGASADGQPGHPVLLPAWLRPELSALPGDSGARGVLARHPDRLRLVPLPGRAAVTDLDTPEDWAAWLARRPPPHR